MDPLHILSSEHWQVSYRRDARYPGSLIVSSVAEASDIVDLAPQALLALGPVLAWTESLLQAQYAPVKVVFYKLGFSKGFSVHFHVLPVTQTLLAHISAHPDYPAEPDGNDAILFVSRVYAERALTPAERALQADEAARLRQCARGLPALDAAPR